MSGNVGRVQPALATHTEFVTDALPPPNTTYLYAIVARTGLVVLQARGGREMGLGCDTKVPPRVLPGAHLLVAPSCWLMLTSLLADWLARLNAAALCWAM